MMHDLRNVIISLRNVDLRCHDKSALQNHVIEENDLGISLKIGLKLNSV